MMVPVRPLFVALVSIGLWGHAVAADDRDATPEARGLVDTPSVSGPRPIPTPRGLEGGAPWTISCYDYPGYRVKQLVGDGKGNTVVSTQVLRAGARLPVCGAQDDPGERIVSKEAFGLVGARGGFVILAVVDGTTNLVFDAASGRQVYSDQIVGENLHSFQVAGDVATMSYVRHVSAPCSFLTGGATCWQRFAREARLPAEVVRMGAPIAACETAFRTADPSFGLRRDIPNVLTYAVTVTFDRGGHSTVLSRANPGCSYDP